MTEQLTNDQLIDGIAKFRAQIDEARDFLSRYEFQLLKNMAAEGSTKYVNDDYEATVTTPVTYDHAKLWKVRELVALKRLVQSGAFTPAHIETVNVPDSWNLTFWKPFAKEGQDIAKIIEAAKIPGAPKLRVTAVEHAKS